MSIGAIFLLIIGVLLIIFSILILNHFRLHPEKEGAVISFLTPFILGILWIISAITDYLGWIILSIFIFCIVMIIYSRYNPEMRKRREKNKEILKNYPIYKFLRIAQYFVVACAIIVTFLVLVIVLFNVRF